MPFPKEATLAGIPVKILGPHISVKDGKWHYSHTHVVAKHKGIVFLAPIGDLSKVEITEQERKEIEEATRETFPNVVRLARAITGTG